MSQKKEKLIARRKAVVANGVGIFNPATAVSAKGAVIKDIDGRDMIDFAGGIGVLNAGHCPEPVVKAIQQQAETLIHTCFNVATYPVYMDLAEKLTTLIPHGDATKVMLVNTGAESVENAIKIARQATGRQAVIAFTESFHGRTYMAMTLTSKVSYKIGCGPFVPEIYRLPFPNYYHQGEGMDVDTFGVAKFNEFEESVPAYVDPKSVAAVILEPVQGEGGFNPVPESFLKLLRAWCDDNGILLILDEVQSGFGRTGKWAAFHHYGITPDISTWAKSLGSGMPIGCVMGKAHIMDAAAGGTIGGTYPGNPVCAAAALATLKYMEEIDINKKGVHVGKIVKKRFLKMQQHCPAIGDVRGIGAMIAIELVKNGDKLQPDADLAHDLMYACEEKGLIVMTAGTHKNCIRILSPLVISDELLNKGMDILEGELMHLYAKKNIESLKAVK
jgi:4-aminobutyrate aminotransferase/(S)-3-amino-2-methylpropionate transaminase